MRWSRWPCGGWRRNPRRRPSPRLEVYFEPAPKPVEKPPEPEQKPEPRQAGASTAAAASTAGRYRPSRRCAPPAEIVSEKPTQAPPKGDKPKDAELAPPPPPLQDVLPSPDQDLAPPHGGRASPRSNPPPHRRHRRRPAPDTRSQRRRPRPGRASRRRSCRASCPQPAGELPGGRLRQGRARRPHLHRSRKSRQSRPQQQQQALGHAAQRNRPRSRSRRNSTPQPQQQQQAKPPMPQLQKPEYQPSPLSTAPSHRPPAGTQSDNPSPSPFVNPADTYNKARAADNYLWQVVRRLQGYRYSANVSATQGITVVRVVIARDGPAAERQRLALERRSRVRPGRAGRRALGFALCALAARHPRRQRHLRPAAGVEPAMRAEGGSFRPTAA